MIKEFIKCLRNLCKKDTYKVDNVLMNNVVNRSLTVNFHGKPKEEIIVPPDQVEKFLESVTPDFSLRG